jgi:hypothetical protein
VPPADSVRPGRELEGAGKEVIGAVLAVAAVGGLLLFISDGGVRLYLGLALFMAGLAGGIVLLARSLVRVRD